MAIIAGKSSVVLMRRLRNHVQKIIGKPVWENRAHGFLERNHGERFAKLMDGFLPDARPVGSAERIATRSRALGRVKLVVAGARRRARAGGVHENHSDPTVH
ncbi:hypothetical protein MSHI_33150 [Mycobacterium shinjukuense]|uniref:Uncharacterized protein n=1 Tax=Mycobacterium shinjukuense TaxID=398694 RepID=A0A7I7MW23_9MYCO|nr:hypothetical protein MSHI_33150 [Mycobacterium shinjukuense]